MDFAVPADHKVKLKESENRDKYLELARDLKKTLEHECNSDIRCNKFTCYNPQRIGKRTGRLGYKKTSRDHSDDSIIKIDKNTEKNPEDLRRLADTQTSVKSHQFTLV